MDSAEEIAHTRAGGILALRRARNEAHRDGLACVQDLLKDLHEVVKLGDIAKVKVLEIDPTRTSIGLLTLWRTLTPGPERLSKATVGQSGGRADNNYEATADRRKAHCRRLPLPFGWLGPL